MSYNRLKQIYLGIIPAYPLGYVLVHGFRGDQIWAKLWTDRSSIEPGEHLKELVEQEIDKLENIKKYRVALTDQTEPKVYGGLYLTSGSELQFPIRANLEDVEKARRLGANLEIDMGFSKYRRKIEVNSAAGDEIIARLMLSEAAKRFLVCRQIQIANSGEFFCIPILAWFGISTTGYLVLKAVSMAAGAWIGALSAIGTTIGAFNLFMRNFEAHKVEKADNMAINRGEEYLTGAIDYFESTLKLNRMIRRVLGEEGERTITKRGDSLVDPVALTKRLRNARKLWRKLKEEQIEDDAE
ncbi:unnamed protein product [Caenorhabditis bovis]|uniref:Uncharacterized protein n=1 Tax=Caenorhabditis bovis TaxID=2654633 RepID=A0A8S1EM25_9PELO|nr:unnamed protein product [Caenorhabditis bovis]